MYDNSEILTCHRYLDAPLLKIYVESLLITVDVPLYNITLDILTGNLFQLSESICEVPGIIVISLHVSLPCL